MSQINRIESFKTFSEMKAAKAAATLAEENSVKRTELTNTIANVLAEMDITSFTDLDEETRNEFIKRAIGEISETEETEEVETTEEVEEVETTEEVEESIDEAIVVTGKRDAKKVMNRYIKFFEAYPALGKNAMGVPAIHHIGAIKILYKGAMHDANFHREADSTVNQMKGRLFAVEVKVSELNNVTIKVPISKLQAMIDDHVSAISQAAGYSGLAIAEGTALYLDSIKKTKEAENLMAKFNQSFNEGVEVKLTEEEINERNAFLGARAKAIEEDAEEFEFNGKTYKVILNESIIITNLNEGEREEQEAMELYTQAAGPDGEYSEDELRKADDKLFMSIVNDGGYKGSRAKKVAAAFAEIATAESVVIEEGRSINKIKKDYDKVINDMADKVKSWKECKANSDAKGEASCLADLKELTTKKNSLLSELDDAVGLKDLNTELAESVEVNEAEITSDEEFKEYATTVLQKAFGEDYDEAKAQEVIDGILAKCGDDYGACVGTLTSSLGESVEVTEANADGTISDDEDERRAELLKRVKDQMQELLASAELDANDIGGSFRAPGIMHDLKKEMNSQLKKFK